MATTNYI